MSPPDALGKYRFVSLLRRGLAAGITLLDDPASIAKSAAVPIQLTFGTGQPTADTSITIVGPKDIVGLDPSTVIRVSPKPGEQDAETIQFAMVEFDQIDLPWRYTPARETADLRLRPWLVLVVLEESEFAYRASNGELPLPQITVNSLSSLPDLTDSWAWAHVQMDQDASPTDAGFADLLRKEPGRFLSRLICPRRLKPSTAYAAFLLPAFRQGRDAGMGNTKDNISPDVLKPAWSASDLTLDHPVFYEWRFATGTAGSFKQLASLLSPRVLPETVGRKDMNVTNPGMGLPRAASNPLQVEGALMSLKAKDAVVRPWPDAERQDWLEKLRLLVNTPGSGVTRTVAPPLYGQWYAAAGDDGLQTQRPGGPNPPWFFELSSDPRSRVAAALGTQVIQRDDQALMLSAWDQAQDVRESNDLLRYAQLGRETAYRMYERHLTSGYDQTLLFMLGGLSERLISNGHSIRWHFSRGECGYWWFNLAWRRLTRTRSKIRRIQGGQDIGDLAERLNQGDRLSAEPTNTEGLLDFSGRPAGIMVTQEQFDRLILIERERLIYWGLAFSYLARDFLVQKKGNCGWAVLKMLRFGQFMIRLASKQIDVIRILVRGTITTTREIAEIPPNHNFTFPPGDEIPIPAPPPTGATGPDNTAATNWREAWTNEIVDQTVTKLWSKCNHVDLDVIIRAIETGLDPRTTIPARIRTRIHLDSSLQWSCPDPLEPLLIAPVYERPMYEPLAEISKEWILPGIGAVENNTVALLVTNQKFVEAYMVGLNQEMNRELLWNEYPADQRATYFRQFWDIRGFVPEPGAIDNPDGLKDIKPIQEFGKDSALGANSSRTPYPRTAPPGQQSQQLVLMVRGEIIRRYPNVTVYAAQSDGTKPSSTEKHPVFWGLLEPDIGFYGFELTAQEASGAASGPGWFFVLQEPPAEPRFSDPTGTSPFVTSTELGEGTSDQVAKHTYQNPMRVAIHGAHLLPS